MRKVSAMSTLILTACLMAGTSLWGAAPQVHHLGPTGLLGTGSKNRIIVTDVQKGSPADGKVKVGDQIVGVGTATFKRDPRRELAAAIDAAETVAGGGKLTLILQGNTRVDLELSVLGSYSATAPWDCQKSEMIINRAAEAILKSKEFGGATLSGLLGLMATGEKKYIDEVARVIRSADWAKPNPADIEAMFAGEKDLGYVGWFWGYRLITLGEYYLLTRDESVLPAIRTYALGLARGQDAGGLYGHRMATPARNGRLPGYAQMNQPSLTSFMGMLMAERCGIDEPVLKKGIDKTYAYVSSFVGRGAFNYGVHGPNTRTYNNNGTSGSAAICMALKGDADGTAFFSQISASSFDGLERGHASTFFNPLWTTLGTNQSGPELTQKFFKEALWLTTMYRSWTGGFSRFGKNEKEGSQTGVALLTYCLPRKALFITGREADAAIWVTGEMATEVLERSRTNFPALNVEELLALFGHPIPQIRIPAVWELRKKSGDFIPRLVAMIENGSQNEKLSAIGYFGWQCPAEQALPQLDRLGGILRNSEEAPEVRAEAAAALSHHGEAAYVYYEDIVRLIAEDRPADTFGDIDWALGVSVNKLCAQPFSAGLVKDRDIFYKAALKLANNKRQHVRADGMRMLEEIPLDDFHLVADTVVHVIEDKDSSYHSYHSPGGPVGSGVAILANLNIREGMQYALGILDIESGKFSFKLRAVMSSLEKYGPHAKPILEQLKADPRWKSVPENKRLKGSWDKMVKAIEDDREIGRLISLEEAKQSRKGR